MRFLKIVFFASVVLFLFSLFFHSVIEFDQDLGRHLLMGKIISQTLSVPKNNLLSYTFPNFQFINSHWLSEVVFFQIDQIFGGVIILLYLKVFILISAFSLTVYCAYRQSKNFVATAVAFAIFAPILLERTEIRPEMFSYLFAAVFVFILFGFEVLNIKHKEKILLTLCLIEILWVNLHIYFILGPILMGIFLTQKIWERYSTTKKIRESLLNTKSLIFYSFLVFAATLFNPNFISGALYPFNVFSNYGYSIVENQNVFFLKDLVFNPNISYFFVATGAFVFSFILTDWKKIKLQTLLIAGLTILPFMAIRSFPLFFLLELPVMAHNLANINPSLINTFNNFKNRHSDRSIISHALIIFVICLTLLRSFRLITNEYYLDIDSHKRFGSQIVESGKGALNFVNQNNLHGPIFNNFDVGSYLAYKLYPKEKVFVDGRPEAYPARFFQGEYIPMQMNVENFKTVEKINEFNLIIFAHTDSTPWAQSFLSEIIKNPDYSLVYLDSYAVVFVRKSAFPNLIAIAPQSAKINDSSYLNNLSYAQIFSLFGWNDLAISSLQKAYSQNSKSPGALSALSSVYSNNPAGLILSQNYSRLFHQKTDLLVF